MSPVWRDLPVPRQLPAPAPGEFDPLPADPDSREVVPGGKDPEAVENANIMLAALILKFGGVVTIEKAEWDAAAEFANRISCVGERAVGGNRLHLRVKR